MKMFCDQKRRLEFFLDLVFDKKERIDISHFKIFLDYPFFHLTKDITRKNGAYVIFYLFKLFFFIFHFLFYIFFYFLTFLFYFFYIFILRLFLTFFIFFVLTKIYFSPDFPESHRFNRRRVQVYRRKVQNRSEI